MSIANGRSDPRKSGAATCKKQEGEGEKIKVPRCMSQ
jgi:hypothetical protein